MRKKLLKSLLLGSLLSMSATAFAANPFALVPTTDWTYDAIGNLVKAGIFEGYRDVNFSKDQTFTRYELATFVGKAMANENKANAQQKATIDKLAAEFKGELTNLGVYAAATTPVVTPAAAATPVLADKLTFGGNTSVRYENTTGSSDNVSTKLYFNIDDKINDDWKVHARIIMNGSITSYKGQDNAGPYNSNGVLTAKADQAYAVGNVNGVSVEFGKMPVVLGQGIVVCTDWAWDGVKFDFGNKLKVTTGYARQADHKKYFFADLNTDITKDLKASATFLRDYDYRNTGIDYATTTGSIKGTAKAAAAEYKTMAVGLDYTGIKNLDIAAEYGKNSVSNAKGWHIGGTFKKADYAKVGSWDATVNYRKARKDFDPEYWSGPDATYAMTVNALNDIEGTEYGFDYVPLTNAKLHIAYGDMTNFAGTDRNNRQYFVTQLTFKF